MSSNPGIRVGKQSASGSFTAIAGISLIQANTRLEVTDTEGALHTFDIPLSGLLAFELDPAAQSGGGYHYFMKEISSLTAETDSFTEPIGDTIGCRFEANTKPDGLALKFIGEDDLDVMRIVAEQDRADNVEFGLQRSSTSLAGRSYTPVNT